MKIGVDLLWVRVGKCGGTESFIRNLLSGFAEYDNKNEYYLFTTLDNAESFAHYCKESKAFHLVKCPIESMSRIKRIAWENTNLDKEAKGLGIDLMYIPVYSMPHRSKKNGIPYVTTIHDLQGFHYPEYFSKPRLFFLKKKWKYAVANSEKIVAISEFTKSDIVKHYSEAEEKTEVIFNPVILGDTSLTADGLNKFGVVPEEYFFCLSSMLPHKNLGTILKTMALRKEKLVLSGVGGSPENRQKLEELINALGIKDRIIVTGFISDAERNMLNKYCKLFLFPSVFEGFGMPPVEAMMLGKKVVTTEKTSIKEITCGKAFYVKDPFDEKEWSKRIDEALESKQEEVSFEQYGLERVTGEYIRLFESIG